jgi:hypothetical protein
MKGSRRPEKGKIAKRTQMRVKQLRIEVSLPQEVRPLLPLGVTGPNEAIDGHVPP